MSLARTIRLKSLSLLAVCTLGLAATATNVRAQSTILVPGNYPTIQSAINAASNGDTVLVSPGTYVENINFLGKNITVTSSNGPAATIIDGNHNGTVATFNHSETAASVLSGFTIRNGFQSGGFGGGISISSASPTISSNVITGNHAVYGIGIYVYDGSATIKNNTITYNDQTGAGSGGFNGSGITVDGIDPAASPQIVANAITNNSSGGGIGIYSNGTPLIQGNLIQGNTSGDGGGLSFQGYGSPIILQNLVVGNAASDNGAGIWISLYNASYRSPVLVVNNTIAENNGGPPHETSGIYTTGFAQNATFFNNVVIAVPGQNGVTCDASSSSVSPVFSHNDAYSFLGAGFAGWCVATSRSGNTFSDPEPLSVADNDFHLAKSSPAVDAGDNTAPHLPSIDYDGNPRLADGNGDGTATIDMGAYELVNTSSAVLNPASLNFNPQAVGTTSPPQSVSLTSSGATPFQVTSIQTTSGFLQNSNCPILSLFGGGLGIPAGDSCSINVVFDATYPFPASGTLTVNGTNGESLTTSLSGMGTNGPVASLSTANLVFSPQIVGSFSAPQLVTFTNPGTGTVNISSLVVNGPFSQISNCGNALTAGSSCTISVVFAPVAFGPANSTLAIQDQINGLNYSVSLGGTGLDFSISPSTTLPGLVAGSSMQIPVSVNALGGNFPNPVSLSCSGLPANATCSFSPLSVVPGASGANSIMTIASQFSTPGGSFLVTITGISTFSSHSAPLQLTIFKAGLTLSANILNFPSQPVGSTSGSLSVVLTNTNVGPVNLSSISASGPFIQTNNCGSVLPIYSTCTVTASFVPVAYGSVVGSLSILDTVDALSYAVNLNGIGVDFSITPAVSALTVFRGTPSSISVNIAALGGPFQNPVSLACVGLPIRTTCGFSPPNPSPGATGATSVLTISTDPSATQAGTYAISIVGSSGAVLHSANLQLTISKNKH